MIASFPYDLHYVFEATHKNTNYTLRCPADNDSPTISAGWNKLQINDRPRREGFTVAIGTDPLQYDIPIRLEGELNGAGGHVEDQIAALEWMGGTRSAPPNTPNPGTGLHLPPTIKIYSARKSGALTNLFPIEYVRYEWYLTNIQYDGTTVLRNGDGNRTRQLAVVSFTKKVNAPSHLSAVTIPGATPATQLNTTQHLNTLKKVVLAKFPHATDQDLRDTLSYTRTKAQSNPKLLRNTPSRIDQKVKPQVPIWVPDSIQG